MSQTQIVLCPNCNFFLCNNDEKRCGWCFKNCQNCGENECNPRLDICDECDNEQQEQQFIIESEDEFPDWSLSFGCVYCNKEIPTGDFCEECEIMQYTGQMQCDDSDSEFFPLGIEVPDWRQDDENMYQNMLKYAN
jgi:hypothetical protein